MPYTDDPKNVPSDAVRFLIGDTNNASLQVTDNEIAYLLAEEGDVVMRAAARAAEGLVLAYTNLVTEKQVGPLRIRYESKVKYFTDLAQRLWGRSDAIDAEPFAGGISRSDKISRALDTDRVRPAFRRRMQEYHGTSYSNSTREDRLG